MSNDEHTPDGTPIDRLIAQAREAAERRKVAGEDKADRARQAVVDMIAGAGEDWLALSLVAGLPTRDADGYLSECALQTSLIGTLTMPGLLALAASMGVVLTEVVADFPPEELATPEGELLRRTVAALRQVGTKDENVTPAKPAHALPEEARTSAESGYGRNPLREEEALMMTAEERARLRAWLLDKARERQGRARRRLAWLLVGSLGLLGLLVALNTSPVLSWASRLLP